MVNPLARLISIGQQEEPGAAGCKNLYKIVQKLLTHPFFLDHLKYDNGYSTLLLHILLKRRTRTDSGTHNDAFGNLQ